MGQVVRSNALRLDDEATFRRLVAELRSRGEIHSTALIDTAFAIAVRQMIRTPEQVADIPAFVAEMQSLVGDRIKLDVAERLLRHAIGQPVSIDDIDTQRAAVIKTLTFMRFAGLVHVTGGDSERFVNSVIVEAETELERRGVPQARSATSSTTKTNS